MNTSQQYDELLQHMTAEMLTRDMLEAELRDTKFERSFYQISFFVFFVVWIFEKALLYGG